MDNDALALLVTKALAYTENGGKPNTANPSAGASGEMKSIFQFMPDTWKLYAKQELGDPNAPLTNENEAVVVHKKVKGWLEAGYKPEQIASMWNAGERRPNAYKENWRGTNKAGVAYDTPAYAKKFVSYMDKFKNEKPTVAGAPMKAPVAGAKIAAPSSTPEKSVAALNFVAQKIGKPMAPQGGMPLQAPQAPQGGLLQQLAQGRA
jgi:hypothetical protein